MGRIGLIVTVFALLLIGALYLVEMRQVNSTRAAVAEAADQTALTLSQSRDLARNTDADAEGIFKAAFQRPSALDDIAVRQSLQSLSAGRLRQSVTVLGRARTSLSEFFNLEGAQIEVVATRDFDQKK